MIEVSDFPIRLGHAFARPELLEEALTHRSVSAEERAGDHNQRLEFLGDAVLGLVLTEALYERFGDVREGVLTRARARLVSREALVERALALGLDTAVRTGRGVSARDGSARDSVLADAYEAVVGAVFLDGGWEAARALVRREFGDLLACALLDLKDDNPKGRLQEMLQAASNETAVYQLIGQEGPDHDLRFHVVAEWRGRQLGSGSGRSKRLAEVEAARSALEWLGSNPEALLDDSC